MKKILIGFTGVAGSGKDTAANWLKHLYGFKSVAFADPIRNGMRAIIGLEDKHFQHPDKEVVLPEFGKSPRQMMQTLGTEWGRDCVNQDLWLILAGKKVDEYQNDGYHVAITDVRFENEAEWLRNKGGLIVHIKRGQSSAVAHVSEAGVQATNEDWVIYNNGPLSNLYHRVEMAFMKAQATAKFG
jgi:hypothetical protein